MFAFSFFQSMKGFFYTASFYLKPSSLFYCISPAETLFLVSHSSCQFFFPFIQRCVLCIISKPLSQAVGIAIFFFLFFFFPFHHPEGGSYTSFQLKPLFSCHSHCLSCSCFKDGNRQVLPSQTHVFDGIDCMLRLKSFHDNLY